ncbi:STAS domain-containing protein [Bradyrhizobium sp. HKCCYLR20261]|uniref:STAS domain-containing protein n=1 Tax=unclassified Bradyrhizobium TaxID=2631580 RepID=UPI003EBD5B7F
MQDTIESRRSLRLPADCSIAAIRGVHDQIREAFDGQRPLEIDCSDVVKADVTSIQLLLSTTMTGAAQGRSVILTSFSQNLRRILQRAGVLRAAPPKHVSKDKAST